MEMADDFDHGIEFSLWTLDDPTDAKSVTHAAPQADSNNACPIARRYGNGLRREDLDGETRRALKPDDLDIGLERPCPRGRRRSPGGVNRRRRGNTRWRSCNSGGGR
jgi:hypothetical protein